MADAASSRGHRNARYLEDRADVLPALETELQENDLLVTMGAGDVLRFGEEWLAKESA